MSTASRHNLPERDQEDITEMIHDLLELKTNILDPQNKVKIDRPHRFGIKKRRKSKARSDCSKIQVKCKEA